MRKTPDIFKKSADSIAKKKRAAQRKPWTPLGDLEARYDGIGNVDFRLRDDKTHILFLNTEGLQKALSLVPEGGAERHGPTWEEVKAAAWKATAHGLDPYSEYVVDAVLDQIQQLPCFTAWHDAGEAVLKSRKPSRKS